MTTPSLPEAIERVMDARAMFYPRHAMQAANEPSREDIIAVCAAASRAEAAEREHRELRETVVSQWMPVCGDSGVLATQDGTCPEHGGDACLVVREMFDLRTRLAAAERELEALRAPASAAAEKLAAVTGVVGVGVMPVLNVITEGRQSAKDAVYAAEAVLIEAYPDQLFDFSFRATDETITSSAAPSSEYRWDMSAPPPTGTKEDERAS